MGRTYGSVSTLRNTIAFCRHANAYGALAAGVVPGNYIQLVVRRRREVVAHRLVLMLWALRKGESAEVEHWCPRSGRRGCVVFEVFEVEGTLIYWRVSSQRVLRGWLLGALLLSRASPVMFGHAVRCWCEWVVSKVVMQCGGINGWLSK